MVEDLESQLLGTQPGKVTHPKPFLEPMYTHFKVLLGRRPTLHGLKEFVFTSQSMSKDEYVIMMKALALLKPSLDSQHFNTSLEILKCVARLELDSLYPAIHKCVFTQCDAVLLQALLRTLSKRII
eukprot:4451666-Amphidinium_carterae.4